MKRIIGLMQEKNHYLEKFYALNEKELTNFLRDNFENLEGFYETRERILEILKYLDDQIELSYRRNSETMAVIAPVMKKAMTEALRIKDEYVARIIEQDLQVLACIEAAKNSIIRDLQDIRKGKKAVSGYRAPDFKQRLSEEA